MIGINKEKQGAVPQKLLHELFDYDSATGSWRWIKKSNPKANSVKVGQPAGGVSNEGYVVISINGYQYYAHRLAWTYVYGDYPDGKQPYIDHINGKRADNRIINLRVSSGAENHRNQAMSFDNTSGVVGVKRRAKSNNSKKNPKINHYWIANWYNEKGKQCEKAFPIHKLGEDKAKQTAIAHRVEQLYLLELNFGIIYSERHGT